MEQIAFDQLFPRPRDFLGDFCETISWQVDETNSAVYLIEIDRLCPAWRGTHMGQGIRTHPTRPHQRIQQTGFPNVAAAQECYFRLRIRRKLLRSRCTYYKPCGHASGQWPVSSGQRDQDSLLDTGHGSLAPSV